MSNPPHWTVPSRLLAGALIVYSALLLGVSLHVFFTAMGQGSPVNAAVILVQSLTALFLPLLIAGIWKPRAASALLFIAAAGTLALTLTHAHQAASATAGMVGASLLLLGVPMLGSAVFFLRISRPASMARK